MIARSASDMILATRRDVAQSGSALGWGPSGRRFESGRPDFLRARNRLRKRQTHERPEDFGDCLPIAGYRGVHGPYRRLLLWRVRGPGFPVQPLRGRQVACEEIGHAHHATQRPFERCTIPALNDLHIVELSCLIFHEAHDLARLARVREEIAADAVQQPRHRCPLRGPVSPPRRRSPGTRPRRTRLSLRPGAARRAPREGRDLEPPARGVGSGGGVLLHRGSRGFGDGALTGLSRRGAVLRGLKGLRQGPGGGDRAGRSCPVGVAEGVSEGRYGKLSKPQWSRRTGV